ncbi:phage tail protein [Pasteurella multocida]|uniref:phage tail protein n=1 Tax=Pasteurella multocida TaxID=747 RepID=UPI001F5321AF|nr:phage tail protein [Pasteurella multocida]
MALKEFKWKVQCGMTTEVTPDVEVVKFGGGYEQRKKSSLNHLPETFNVRVRLHSTRDKNDIDGLMSFLTEHVGWKSFNWVVPKRKSKILVVCDKYSTTENGVYVDFEMSFRQVFN